MKLEKSELEYIQELLNDETRHYLSGIFQNLKLFRKSNEV